MPTIDRNAVFLLPFPGLYPLQLSAEGVPPDLLTAELNEWVYSCLVSPEVEFKLEPTEGWIYTTIYVGLVNPQPEAEKRLFFARREDQIVYFREEDSKQTLRALRDLLGGI